MALLQTIGKECDRLLKIGLLGLAFSTSSCTSTTDGVYYYGPLGNWIEVEKQKDLLAIGWEPRSWANIRIRSDRILPGQHVLIDTNVFDTLYTTKTAAQLAKEDFSTLLQQARIYKGNHHAFGNGFTLVKDSAEHKEILEKLNNFRQDLLSTYLHD